MQYVNRHTIRIPDGATGATDFNLTVPVNLTFQNVDQFDIIKTKFVDVEVENSINPIVDYEKVRLIPVDMSDQKVYKIIYKMRFLPNVGVDNYWSDAGFSDDDIKFRKNRWKKSFLRLNFYDSDVPTDQRLLSFTTLFPELLEEDVNGLSAVAPDLPSTPKKATQIPASFRLSDPIMNPRGFAEGYHLYHFKDEIPRELYMRPTFNNASDGKSYNLMTIGAPQTIDNLVNYLHVKYILKRDSTGYYYTIDDTYSTNVDYTSDSTGRIVTVTLYQIQAL
jgi:hypothetical protein